MTGERAREAKFYEETKLRRKFVPTLLKKDSRIALPIPLFMIIKVKLAIALRNLPAAIPLLGDIDET